MKGSKKKSARMRGEGTYWRDPETGEYCWRRRFGKSGKGQRSVVVREVDYQIFRERVEREQQRAKTLKLSTTIDKQTTWSQIFDLWLELHVRPPLREQNTYDSYKERIENALRPQLGPVKALDAESTALSLQLMVNKMRRSKDEKGSDRFTARTINYSVEVWRNCARKMKLKGMVAEILSQLTLPEPDEPRDRVLTAEEVEEVREQLGKFMICSKEQRISRRDEPMLVFAFNAGPRVNELLAVLKTDINKQERTVKFDKQIERYKDEKGVARWRFKKQKGKKQHASRVVGLNDDAMLAVTRQFAQIAEDKLRAGPAYEDHGLLFATESGKPRSDRNVLRTINRVVEAVNAARERKALQRAAEAERNGAAKAEVERAKEWIPMEQFTTHDLRRTMLTHLADSGAAPHVLAAVAGHAKGSPTTQKHYVWAQQKLQRETVQNFKIGKKEASNS
jgi:integrase